MVDGREREEPETAHQAPGLGPEESLVVAGTNRLLDGRRAGCVAAMVLGGTAV